jgi:all-trans-retinol 13,14-reductase
MTNYDVVIIGGGLGGLLCGSLLSREGMRVCIIERNSRLGGAIQSFARNGVIFNTGLNYTESLGEGEILRRYFNYFGIFDRLNILRMDVEAFEKISFQGNEIEYPFAQGHDLFVERLARHFPAERENLKSYMNFLGDVCRSFPLYTLDGLANRVDDKMLNINAFSYIQSVVKDPLLQQILGGMSSLYAGDAQCTPLYVHALINSSFVRSSWRMVDGSAHMVRAIADTITQNGGEIIRRAEVVRLGGKEKGVEYAELANGEKIFAKHFISNVHPAVTLSWVDANISKRAHFHRINDLCNTTGMFSLYLTFKPDLQPYINYNHHFFKTPNVWNPHYNVDKWPEHFMFYTPAISKSTQWADGGVAITYMRYEEVAQWANSSVGNRGEAYEAFKREKAEKLIDCMEQKFPGIRSRIDSYYTSTPLTHRDYTGSPEGSAYGITKNGHDAISTIISARSRVGNLYFTGQNLNMHGILGVTISSILTCMELLGHEYVLNHIKQKS